MKPDKVSIYLLFVCLFIYLSISLQAQLPDVIFFNQKKKSFQILFVAPLLAAWHCSAE